MFQTFSRNDLPGEAALKRRKKEKKKKGKRNDATKARVRSQAGAEAGAFLRASPVCENTQVDNEHFNLFLRRRARLPLSGGARRCPGFRLCQSYLDCYGDHLAACPSTGLLKRRGTAFERVYRPLWKESGVRETPQPLVKDLLSDADPTDLRKSDFEIRGCALGRGLPVVCDMCMGSALHSDGTPYAGASNVDGATIDRLTHRKRVTEYPDLATSPQIEYLVLACEEGGRWGPDQHRLLRSLVRTKVASIHPLLRRRASLAYTRRWWGILSIGAQTVAADCILGRDSPVPAPTTVLPLASVLPLIDVGTKPSRMR